MNQYKEKVENFQLTQQKNEQKIASLQERNKVLEYECEGKAKQIDQLQEMLKVNQRDNNELKYKMRELENKHSKLQLEYDIVQSKHKAVSSEKDQTRLLLQEAAELKEMFEKENKKLSADKSEFLESHNLLKGDLAAK